MIPIFVFLTRFSVDYTTKHLKDDGWNSPTRLTWWQVYFLMVAGGLFHFAVDITMETKRFWPFPLSDPVFIDVLFFRERLPEWALIPNEWDYLAVVPFAILLCMLYFGNRHMQQIAAGVQKTRLNVLVGVCYGLFLLFYTLFGLPSGENDFGAIAYFGLFFFAPFTLNLLARFPENQTPLTTKTYHTEFGPRKVKIVIGWLFFCGILFGTAAIGAYTFLSALLSGIEEISRYMLPIVLAVAFFSGLFFLSAILLQRKNVRGMRIAQILLMLSGVFIIPLVIYGLLREQEVLEILEQPPLKE
jgi:hypothetical protein